MKNEREERARAHIKREFERVGYVGDLNVPMLAAMLAFEEEGWDRVFPRRTLRQIIIRDCIGMAVWLVLHLAIATQFSGIAAVWFSSVWWSVAIGVWFGRASVERRFYATTRCGRT